MSIAEKEPAVAQESSVRASWKLPALFTLTAFLGASLLFVVQPLVAKLLLPSYGGAATVWATSSLFFQTALLGAYLLVHGTARFGPRRQPLFLSLPLVLLALVTLPLALPSDAAEVGDSPILWLLRTLFIMIGLPFAVLATTGPLLQKWYSWSAGPRAQDPYFLYAASNVGSFVGLLSYPFLVEPTMDLATQRFAWTGAFCLFIILVAACAFTVRNSTTFAGEVKLKGTKPALRREVKWVLLAFLPSSLLLGVTTHITTDVASIPLLWVVPLAIYLATMVAAFASSQRSVPPVVTQAAVVMAVLTLAVSMLGFYVSVLATAVTIFAMLAVVAYAAHAHLAADRPEPAFLTRYYVMVSLGGALGGLLNGMVAPLIFSGVYEFALILALTPLLLLAAGGRKTVVGLTCVVLLGGTFIQEQQNAGNSLENSRTFYGSYIVKDFENATRLIHGTTIHGTQFKGDLSREPNSYYSRSGPLGELFESRSFSEVEVVGLGTGTVAAYGEPDQTMRFVEIDPEVIRIAKTDEWFTFLKDSEADVSTVVGDGRLEVEKLPDNSLDMLVLDAFSSDSIPVHLLTKEAFEVYGSKMKEDGVIAVHISNRLFGLAPVVISGAQAIDGKALYAMGEEGELSNASTWVMVTKDAEEADRLVEETSWEDITDEAAVEWTDNYSSLLDVLY